MGAEPFLSRWSRRKDALRRGDEPPPEPLPPTPATAATVEAPAPAADTPAAVARADTAAPPPVAEAPPPPTLEEASALTPQSDFRRFVARDVDPAVRHTALRTLFRDPHFNVMDGLDTYIDDYGRPDPIPASMLAKLSQSVFLRLAPPEPAAAPPVGEPPLDAGAVSQAPPADAAPATGVAAASAPDAAASDPVACDPAAAAPSTQPRPADAGAPAGPAA